jgi:hypothetical protein
MFIGAKTSQSNFRTICGSAGSWRVVLGVPRDHGLESAMDESRPATARNGRHC